MKSTVVITCVLGLAASSLLTGCASIVSGRHADVSIDSYPTNADVFVQDNDGHTVASIRTPGTVSLKRNRRFFLPARYTAVMQAPGYEMARVPIRSTVNPWILGNVIVGGLPGLIVDNATGAAWQPRESQIHRQLEPIDCTDEGSMYSADEAAPGEPADPAQYVAERSGDSGGGEKSKSLKR